MVYEDFMLRIGLALFLGFSIGLERQLTGHMAGIRINVLISLGTCFFMLFPMMFESGEPFRIASYIISGVGFLCSGVIFKDSASVRGINTAATLWCSAAIGILSSTGRFLFAVSAAMVLITSNLLLRPLAARVRPLTGIEENERQYRISVTCAESAEDEIRSLIINNNTCRSLFLCNLESGDINGEKVEIYADYLSVGKAKDSVLEGIVRKILERSSVNRAGWEVRS